MKNKKAFTLIELLVVVLIIGVLSAIALPQYQKAVEKARMAEAFILLRAIRDAQIRYYLANGEYASFANMDALDITIPHSSTANYSGQARLVTKDFAYTCHGTGANEIAVAQRMPIAQRYYLSIESTDLEKIICVSYEQASDIQKNLCARVNASGTL